VRDFLAGRCDGIDDAQMLVLGFIAIHH